MDEHITLQRLKDILVTEDLPAWREIDEIIKNGVGVERTFIRFLNMRMRNLLISICTLWPNKGLRFSIYVLGRSVVEDYINGMFVLKGNTESKCQEFIDAHNEKRKPFLGEEKWGRHRLVEERAKSAGLTELYNKSYKSLCHFTHPSASCYHVFDPNHKQYREDGPKFLMHMLELYAEYLNEITEKCDIKYPEKFRESITGALNYTKTSWEQFNKNKNIN